MATVVTIRQTVTVNDGTVERVDLDRTTRFAAGVGTSGQHTQVSLTGGAFTSITVPSGAKCVVLETASAAVSCTIKGISGDTGTTILPASNPVGLPIIASLGATPSLGILNSGSTATVDVWFY